MLEDLNTRMQYLEESFIVRLISIEKMAVLICSLSRKKNSLKYSLEKSNSALIL